MDDLLSYGDVAKLLGVSRRHVATLSAEGHLAKIYVGPRAVRFHPDDVEAFLQARRNRRPRRRGEVGR